MKKIISVAFALALLPFFAAAQTGTTASSVNINANGTNQTSSSATTPSSSYNFQSDGIFGCNQNGAYAMSVGALSAQGGAYVPVADATVELNTGILVYKECVLREVVDREREAATSALLQKAYQAIQNGRNGGPQYVVNQNQEVVSQAIDPTLFAILQGSTLQNMNPAFLSDVKDAVAQTYAAEINSPQNILTCPVQGNLTALETAQPGSFNWIDFRNEANPACYELGAEGLAQALTDNSTALASGNLSEQWLWGNGYYPQTDSNGNVITPATNVQESFQAQLDSPLTQLQSANDIGQMIGALYAGVTTQILSSNQGLAGLSQSAGGQPSYLSQVETESSQGVQGAADNAALTILNAALQVETAYQQAVQGIASNLTQSIHDLQGAENQCWANIIAKACATPLSANNTCTSSASACSTDPTTGTQTCPTAVTLKVATSTAFSQAIISSQIASLATATVSEINSSQTALSLINSLIAGITNTSSLDAQSLALEQLDQLVANHQLHTQTDLNTLTTQATSIQTSMMNLVQTTEQNWSGTGTDSNGNQLNNPWDGTTNPAVGWCNWSNATTIADWQQKWKE